MAGDGIAKSTLESIHYVYEITIHLLIFMEVVSIKLREVFDKEHAVLFLSVN
jgi:hypothetical protein